MADDEFRFINLNIFFALHPDLTFDSEFQTYLAAINTGSVGFDDADLNIHLLPEQILDRDEIQELLENPNPVVSSLWKYASEMADAKLLKNGVQQDYFAHTEITGNVFADLVHETRMVLQSDSIDITSSPEVLVSYAFESTQVLQFKFEADPSNSALYRYYAATMGLKPEQVFLLVQRAIHTRNASSLEFELKERNNSPNADGVAALEAVLAEWENLAQQNPIDLSFEPQPVVYPEWVRDSGVNDVEAFIEGAFFDFYLKVYEDYSKIGIYANELISQGCSRDFVYKFLYANNNNDFYFLAGRFLASNGYLIMVLEGKPFLAKAQTRYEYTGLATPTREFGEYTIVRGLTSYNFDSTATPFQEFAIGLQAVPFDSADLRPFLRLPGGKKMIRRIFGNPPELDPGLMLEFSHNLQRTLFLFETDEVKAGRIATHQSKKEGVLALLWAMEQSSNPEQLFLYLYALNLKRTSLYGAWTEALADILITIEMPSEFGLDATDPNEPSLVATQMQPVLTDFSEYEDVRALQTLQRLVDLFNFKFSDAETSLKDRLKQASHNLVFENVVLQNSSAYFSMRPVSHVESVSKPDLPLPESDSNDFFDLHWFEKIARQFGLNAQDFQAIDHDRDGQIAWEDFNALEWTGENKYIFERVAHRYERRVGHLLRQAKPNQLSLIPIQSLSRRQQALVLKQASPNFALTAEALPRHTLKRMAETESYLYSEKDALMQLQARFPRQVGRVLKTTPGSRSDLAVQYLQKIFDNHKTNAVKLNEAREFLLYFWDVSGFYENKFDKIARGKIDDTVVLFVAEKLRLLAPAPNEVSDFFADMPVVAQESLAFFAYGLAPSRDTFKAWAMIPGFHREIILKNFHNAVPSTKPSWFDDYWQCLGENSTDYSWGLQPEKTDLILSLVKGLNYPWVQEIFFKFADENPNASADFFARIVQSDGGLSVGDHLRLFDFVWDQAQPLHLNRSNVLSQAVIYFMLPDSNVSNPKLCLEMIRGWIGNLSIEELTKLSEEAGSAVLFGVVLVLQADPNRDGSDFCGLWVKNLRWVSPEMFRKIGFAGEIAIDDLCHRLRLNSEETARTRQYFRSLFVNFDALEQSFRQADIYFQQMNAIRDGDPLGARYVVGEHVDEHLQNAKNQTLFFYENLMAAIRIVRNPLSPVEEQAKATELKNHMETWMKQTSSVYMKTLLCFCLKQLDPEFDSKTLYAGRARFQNDDPLVNPFERRLYKDRVAIGEGNNQFINWLISNKPISSKALGIPVASKASDLASAQVLFFESSLPDGFNHASGIQYIYDANGVASKGLVLGRYAETGFDDSFLTIFEAALDSLNLQETSARVLTFSVGENLQISRREAKALIASDAFQNLRKKIEGLNRQGVVIVVAAGNEGSQKFMSYLNELNVLSLLSPPLCIVAAQRKLNSSMPLPEVSAYSSAGSLQLKPTLTAFSPFDGTSFSTPEAGSVAVKIGEMLNNSGSFTLTGEQKVLCMMLACEKFLTQNRMKQGVGELSLEKSLWFAYCLSANRTEVERRNKADELGLAQDYDFLMLRLRQCGDEFHNNPRRLWRKLLYR